ncbi:MAG: NYN domain-containing protein [Phycisphaerales bacterium]|nr:NYN domain-containing protein [Phycisphaerales bacterium]
MMYLLDTYNILHAAVPMGGSMSSLTVRTLCQWIVSGRGPRRIKAVLVLDGRAKPDEPTENEFPDVELVYAGASVSADKVIGQLVERAGSKKKVTVVTSDRAVALHARQHFANAMSSEAFLEMLLGAEQSHRRAAKSRLPERKTGGTSSPGETLHWLKEFGLSVPPPGTSPQSSSGELTDEEIERLMGGG